MPSSNTLAAKILQPTSITKALVAIVTHTVVWGAVVITTHAITCSHPISRHVFHHVPHGTVLITAFPGTGPVRGAWFCAETCVTLITCAVIGALTDIIGVTMHTPDCNARVQGIHLLNTSFHNQTLH